MDTGVKIKIYILMEKRVPLRPSECFPAFRITPVKPKAASAAEYMADPRCFYIAV